MTNRIFISYSRKDFQKARQIKRDIEKNTSVSCWMDVEGIKSGSQFEDIIISAIDDAQIVVLLLSMHSMQSHWVKDEIRYAYETEKKVVPVNIDGCTPRGWFLFKFSGRDVIYYNDPEQYKKLMSNLVEWTRVCQDTQIKEDSHNIKTEQRKNSVFSKASITEMGAYMNEKISLSHNNIDLNPITKAGFVIQCLLLCVSAYLPLFCTFNGALSGGHSRFPLYLDVLLICSGFATYFLFKGKKYAFYAICLLDILEIYYLTKMSYTAYYLNPRGSYTSTEYKNLWALGSFIKSNGFIITNIILSLATVVHISIMVLLLKLKNQKGESGWSLLK